ncbi:phage tail protein [Providencia rettgeri]
MQDLMPPINTPNSAFHDGDPTTGQLGTIVTALWLNNVQSATRDVQLEIKNVLAKAGIQSDPKKTNQLAEAISQIIGSGNYASTTYVDNGLNKKIDKASISGVLGNDNSKVPSLNLLTTELGKKQPAGNYAPAGDYATNAALNNGLNAKFDKTSIVQITGSSTTQVMSQDAATKAFMKPGDFGLGATKTTELIKENDYTNSVGRTFGFIYNNSDAIGAPSNFGGGIVFGRDPKLSASILYSPDWTTRLYLSSAIDTKSGKMSGFVEFYSTGNTKIDRNGNLKASGFSDALTDFPVGVPIPWPQSTAPAGYLVCNGQTFNKNTYPLLAQAYPSGILPDLRGEFIRGLDAGRNIDNGRAVLSAQSDAIRNITGSIETTKSNTKGEGVFSSSTNGTTGAASDSTGSVKLYAKAVFKASDSVPTANENRPRNIAFLYIVRAA